MAITFEMTGGEDRYADRNALLDRMVICKGGHVLMHCHVRPALAATPCQA